MVATRWRVFQADPQEAQALAGPCGIDPLLGQLLLNRGVSQPAEAARFLNPTLDALDDPLALPDMANAVSRIRRALRTKQPILIFGDSDLDGVTAAAIVYETLTALLRRESHAQHSEAAPVSVRLSNRLADGYGFPPALIQRVIRDGVKLVIIVDCGTNQPEELRRLARRGIDTVVLDHHLPMGTPAEARAMVNPHRGSGVGRELCSAGLALKLAQALWPDNRELLLGLLDLAALGTLADYAPLRADNRIVVSVGLARLLATDRPGLKQLCDAVGLVTPTPEPIARKLIPPLNAAGRLGNARPVWNLLVERSVPASTRLVEIVRATHGQTKLLHRQIMAEAHAQVSRIHFKDHTVMVIGGRGWHPGFMGPLAAQLAEQFGRPAIAIALDEAGMGVGSGRSPAAFDLFEALRACDGMLLRYGGHPRACGLTLRRNDLDRFRDTINQHAHAVGLRERLVQTREIDLALPLRALTAAFAASAQRLAPFGPGNPPVSLLFSNLQIREGVSGGWTVSDRTVQVRMRGRLAGLLPAERYDVVATPGCVDGAPLLSLCELRVSAVQNTGQPEVSATALS